MERNSASRASGFIAAAWLGILFALAAPAEAQLGHVVKAQKISATSGGFTAQLEEMDQFGRSILNLGDLDGDGISDLMVGAHTDDDGGLDQGAVYVLFLHANGFVKAWQKISDLEGNFTGKLKRGDQFGRATANLGDLDGDGVVDVAVSSNYDDDGGTNKGAVYVLFLNADGTVKSSQKISSTSGGLPVSLNIHDEFGRSLCALGDLDGDGLTELMVGTPEDDEGGTNTGALHVLFLNADGTVKGYHRISKFSENLALKPGDWFGFCSANLGDLDGDGVVDVAAGSVLDDDGGVNQGSLWILFLNPDGSVKASREIDELEGGFALPLDDIDQFGTSVANLGDLDGDGVIDIAVGAVKDDDGGTPGDPDADVGAAYVLFLNADGSVKSTVKVSDLFGDMPYALDQWDWFGSALARYGGSPGDGLFNAVIGCRNDDDAGGNQGAIYVVQLNDGTVPAAGFVASRMLGVAPLTVDFTDASTGQVTAWVWNFGDGPQSSLQHPTKTYAAPGSYDVQLTTRGPRGTDIEVKSAYITVVVGPLADFEATPRSGSCPLSVAFDDLSEGEVTSWSWDFGDGQSSSSFAPVHLYDACGSYTVALTVSGPNGTHTLTRPDFVIAALQPPQAGFSALPTLGAAPLDVQFADLTTGQVTAWSWDFGDGQVSSEASPLHRYEAEGLYTVTLTSSGPGGSDGETRLDFVSVGVAPPTAYFEATPTLGPQPLTVAFSDASSGAITSWSWDFGDGQSANAQNPVHVYAASGLYSITLRATGPAGTHLRTRTDLVSVEVAPPGAAFTVAPASGSAPLAAQFSDLSTSNPSSWSWNFGDGATSSAQNPAHVYTAPGLYTVSLTVTSPGGSDTLVLSDLIVVAAPPTTADFGATPLSGTAPLTVAFLDASTPNVNIWAWNFGDGGSANTANPVHVYTVPGTYSVSLTVSSPTGADVRTRTDLVTVLEAQPEALFTALPATGVAPLGVQFQDQSLGNVGARSWDFGDGASSSASAPFHVFNVPGSFTVALTVSGPGGSNTLTVVDAVQVSESAPVAAFSAAPSSGAAPLAVQFA
ncbi:MAG: PKD domain-containing protein, partial [Planctomycetes bacterium]|nr:PKD domain-containing protein [Planctomycetota bacterium]